MRADLDTPDAWDLTRGSTNIIVAIVDTGINAGLAEFEGRLVDGYDFINDDPDPEDGLRGRTRPRSITPRSRPCDPDAEDGLTGRTRSRSSTPDRGHTIPTPKTD